MSNQIYLLLGTPPKKHIAEQEKQDMALDKLNVKENDARFKGQGK